jgi:hypothetical protein
MAHAPAGRGPGDRAATGERQPNRAASRAGRSSASAGSHSFSAMHVHAPPPAETEPLPAAVRRRLEGDLGAPLDGMRVSAGAEGARVAARHGAVAVCEGATVHFGAGAFEPESERGRRLLRHEAAHFLQRRTAAARPGPAWPAPLLEAEADTAALGRRTGRPIAGRAGPGPLLRRTFISTVGGNPYFEQAVKFYKLWENETAERIGSYQDIVEKLSGDTAPLTQFRIVAHANGSSLFLPLLAGAKEYADIPALERQTQESLAEHLGDLAHVTSDMSGKVHGWVEGTSAGKALLAKLGIATAPDGIWREYVRWIVDEHLATNATEDDSGTKTTATERKALVGEIQQIQASLKKTLAASLPTGAAEADVDALRQAALAGFKADAWTWGELPAGALKERLERFQHPEVAAVRTAVKQGTFEKKLAAVKARVSSATDLEIRGCNIGSNDDYLQGIREFFGTAPGSLPSISAPKLYHYFGNPGVLRLPETEAKAPPVAESLKFLFEETFDDASTAEEVADAVKKARLHNVGELAAVLRHADVKAEFIRWWNAKQRREKVKEADLKDATFADFQSFIESGSTFELNAPGVSAQSTWYMILLPSHALDAMVAWVRAQGYVLPGGADLRETLFGKGAKYSDTTLLKGRGKLVVDWLGDKYPVPDTIHFPRDPEFAANIRRIP